MRRRAADDSHAAACSSLPLSPAAVAAAVADTAAAEAASPPAAVRLRRVLPPLILLLAALAVIVSLWRSGRSDGEGIENLGVVAEYSQPGLVHDEKLYRVASNAAHRDERRQTTSSLRVEEAALVKGKPTRWRAVLEETPPEGRQYTLLSITKAGIVFVDTAVPKPPTNPSRSVNSDLARHSAERKRLMLAMAKRAGRGDQSRDGLAYRGTFLRSSAPLSPNAVRLTSPDYGTQSEQEKIYWWTPLPRDEQRAERPRRVGGDARVSDIIPSSLSRDGRFLWIHDGDKPDATVITTDGWYQELAADRDLMESPLDGRESARVVARGLYGSAECDADGGIFWRKRRPYPDKRIDLYYLPRGETKPHIVRDFPEYPRNPIAYQGRLYWLEHGGGAISSNWGDLFSCDLNGDDRQLVLPLTEGSERAHGQVPLFVQNGRIYLTTTIPAPAIMAQHAPRGIVGPPPAAPNAALPVADARKTPVKYFLSRLFVAEGSPAVSIDRSHRREFTMSLDRQFPGLSSRNLLDGNYIYFAMTETRRPWNDWMYSQSTERRVTALYRLPLP